MASVRRSACVRASMTCTTPFQCAQTNKVSPSGETAMPSAPCGIAILLVMRREAVSTTATVSLVLNEANSLPVEWLTVIQCGAPPRSMRSTLSVSGSIASTALPNSAVDHNVPPASHHHRMRRIIVADIDGAFELFRRQIDDRDATVGVFVLAKNATAIDRRINLAAVRRADHLMRRRRHINLTGLG